ncbi:MAG: ostA-like family protein [Proteobacteria bacterium]|nr:ostA-like family protein [Pseudomonadota bacterium]
MIKIFLMVAGVFLSGVAWADSALQPVEISAAKSLEWNRVERTYTAREKVLVVQGAMRLQSDVLTARYNDENGMTNISTLEAQGRIIIQSPPYTAYGDNATYNVKTGNAMLTGKNLRITTDADTLTARDKIEFFGAENRLVARGNATASHDDDILTADRLDAFFSKQDGDQMKISKVTATGNVTIKTAKETVTGDAGVYDIPTQKAVLTGKVRIRQGENWLEGTRANIDMATGISQLLGSGNAETEGRVKGVFYPKALKRETGSH